MTHRPSLVSCIVLVAALLACKREPSTETAPTSTPTPTATTPSPAANPADPTVTAEPEAPTGPRKLTADEVRSRLKQTMHGHVAIPEQSFAVTVKGLGEISVLSSMSPNGTELVFHVYDGNGKRTQSLLNKNVSMDRAQRLLAVSFPDVDGDGNEDFVALGSYSPAAGKQVLYNVAAVFTRPGGGRFVFDAQRSERASRGRPSSIAAAAQAAR